MSAKIKMEVLQTFDGNEGFVMPGDKIEVATKTRAEGLAKAKLAKYVKASKKEKEPEKDVKEQAKELTLEEILAASKSHKELDQVVKEFKFEDVPTRDDGATMDERKKAIVEAAEKRAE